MSKQIPFNRPYTHFDGETTSYTSNISSYTEMYDNEYKRLMELPKETLVTMLIGERPIFGPILC